MTQGVRDKSAKAIADVFGVSERSVQVWRREEGLAHDERVEGTRKRYYFNLEEVRAWCIENGKELPGHDQTPELPFDAADDSPVSSAEGIQRRLNLAYGELGRLQKQDPSTLSPVAQKNRTSAIKQLSQEIRQLEVEKREQQLREGQLLTVREVDQEIQALTQEYLTSLSDLGERSADDVIEILQEQGIDSCDMDVLRRALIDAGRARAGKCARGLRDRFAGALGSGEAGQECAA